MGGEGEGLTWPLVSLLTSQLETAASVVHAVAAAAGVVQLAAAAVAVVAVECKQAVGTQHIA